MQYLQALSTILIVFTSVISLSSFKFNIKEFLVIVAIAEVLCAISTNFGDFAGIIPILVISIIYLYKKDKSIVKSIAIPVISVIIAILSDYLLTSVSISLFGMGIDAIKDNAKFYWVVVIIEFILVFIISNIIGVILNKKSKISNMEFTGKFAFLIVTSLVLTLIIFYANIILGSTNNGSNEIIKVNGILFSAYFILLMIIMYILIRSIAKELEVKNKQTQLETMQEYTNNLEKLYTDMRAFRHDYINILSSMIGYMQNEDLKGLEKYFDQKIIPLNQGMESNNFKIGLLKNIQLPEIKGIFSSKLIRAQELGIDVFIDILEPIERIDMDVIDLCRCVGILLDNAIEAVQAFYKPSMRVALINKERSVLIVIINDCSEDVPPIHKIYQKNFSTKGENRGLGLNNLKEMVGKYSNVSLETVIENGEFKQHLEIRNN